MRPALTGEKASGTAGAEKTLLPPFLRFPGRTLLGVTAAAAQKRIEL